MPKITWLTATYPAVSLTKTISKVGDELVVNPYPHAMRFTSETVEVKSMLEFCKALSARQKSGQCLLKGELAHPLVDESRAGSTTSDGATGWVCFDLDKANYKKPQEFMDEAKLHDVSYVVQYSASQGLATTKGLSCHIFVMLDKALSAHQLKSWLMSLNFSVKTLRDGLRLSRNTTALSYSLDITCCQNDKLIYVTAPMFKGMKDPLKERIEYVKHKRDTLNAERIPLHAPEAIKKIAREVLNEKRTAAQLPLLRAKVQMVGEFEVQNSPGEMLITEGPKVERDFVYFNINGGRNWSYFHPATNYELIHNFKGEPCLRTKDVFPNYYKECVRERNKANLAQTDTGDELLAFCEDSTTNYWCGWYNEGTGDLHLSPARSETQVDHFMKAHQRDPIDPIPRMLRVFDPTPNAPVIDRTNRLPTVNLFTPSALMRSAKVTDTPTLAGAPTISRIIEHAIGSGEILDHFYNWLAVMFHLRVKPGTAWVLHGVEGTGKDTLVHRILKPLFGERWTIERNQNELTSDFTGWMEFALIAHIREIEIDSLEKGNIVESKLKNFIADETVPIRRMRVDSYQVKNYTGMIFSSNKNKPVRIPPTDRRYNIGSFQVHKLEVTSEELEVMIPNELQAFADYLMSRKADRNKARTPLRTQERDDLMALSRTSADHLAQFIKDGNLEGLWASMPDVKALQAVQGASFTATYANAFVDLMKRCLMDVRMRRQSRLSREDLLNVFTYCIGNIPNSPNKFTMYLAHHDIKLSRIRVGTELRYGVTIEWTVTDSFLKDVEDRVEEETPKLAVVQKRKAG
jgi:hypothetical protein